MWSLDMLKTFTVIAENAKAVELELLQNAEVALGLNVSVIAESRQIL